MICVVTCTENRPALFARCKLYVQRQTIQPDLWLIKTSRREDLGDLPPWANVLLGPAAGPFPNLQLTLRHVPKDHDVVIMEDDDWYAPDHIATMTDFRGKMLSGNKVQNRYNVPARKWNAKSPDYAGPGQCAIHRDAVQFYADHLMEPIGDTIPWKHYQVGLPVHPTTCLGIKGVGYGLPGTPGKTVKHNPRSQIVQDWTPDPSGAKLREWIGEDAEFYLGLVKR